MTTSFGLVVDEDDKGKFRLERVLMLQTKVNGECIVLTGSRVILCTCYQIIQKKLRFNV